MRFYRTDDAQWFATQAEAKAHAKRLGTRWGPVDVPTEKPALLAWLAAQAAPSPETLLGPQGDIAVALGAEPAEPVLSEALATIREPATPQADYAHATVALDTAFAAAPLAQQLTLAALALENARGVAP